MTDERKRHTGWLTAAAVVLVLLGAYVCGYFVLGEYEEFIFDGSPDTMHVRRFSSGISLTAYYPVGWIECHLRGDSVHIEAANGREHHFSSPDDRLAPP